MWWLLAGMVGATEGTGGREGEGAGGGEVCAQQAVGMVGMEEVERWGLEKQYVEQELWNENIKNNKSSINILSNLLRETLCDGSYSPSHEIHGWDRG